MADIETIFNGSGPLPVRQKFQVDSDEPMLLYVAGTGWAERPGLLSVTVGIDGKAVGSASVYTNEPNSHKALVATIIQAPALTIGSHELELTPLPGTNTDANDVFTVSAILGKAAVIAHNGGIPWYTTLESQVQGDALVFLSGSAYRNPAGPIGISLVIDHEPVLQSDGWVNEPSSHHALPPVMGVTSLTPGSHQIGFSMTSGETQTDGNDNFCMAVFF